MAYKIGDVVQLKSGGPWMTVSYLRQDAKVDCTWFNEEGTKYEQKAGTFHIEMLKQPSTGE